MRTFRQSTDMDGLTHLDGDETKVLSAKEEREILSALNDCKKKLADALAKVKGNDAPKDGDDPRSLAQFVATCHTADGPMEAKLGAVFRKYAELRGKLALANMRLVAHVAKRFRERGISYSDLLQEGFCGLLEAIDRFDMTHETKLATYATWWIRQAMQRAVASGAYPVRLSPRHLRQLAQNQDGLDRVASDAPTVEAAEGAGSTELIHRIHTATRPTISLDTSHEADSNFNLLQIMSDPEGDRTDEIDTDEAINRLLEVLKPREQEVLALRFGLAGKPRLSLSQVGKVLEVSKERVRQIQDRALEKLRSAAEHHNLTDLLVTGV
ncbi:MAG: sigma-70 family RNA polymerase sigma factor [Isosphaeraceae bacterium]